MKYNQIILLKNGKECCLRNCDDGDGRALFDNFHRTHEETDYLLSYPDEDTYNGIQANRILKEKAESNNEIEILAIVDNTVVGSAGIDAIGSKYKVRHRAEFGIGIIKEFWGLGIGKALTNACIQCAKEAGYTQLELDVVATNKEAIALYEKVGFVEYGRNPKGFRSRIHGFQELVYMRLEL